MPTYEFTYTDSTDGTPQPSAFTLGGISENVARGIRFGLKKAPQISDVTGKVVTQQRADIPGPDPA